MYPIPMQLVEQGIHVKRNGHVRRVHVCVQAKGRNHGQQHGLAHPRLLLESSEAVAQFHLLFKGKTAKSRRDKQAKIGILFLFWLTFRL